MAEDFFFFCGKDVIVRTMRGVFFGFLKEEDFSKQVISLENVIAIKEWQGAATLSQLSVDGPKHSEGCVFLEAGSMLQIPYNVLCEIIPTTDKASESIKLICQKNKSKYVFVHSDGAGCFAGELLYKRDSEVVLKKARRLWSLKEEDSIKLTESGPDLSKDNKFTKEVEIIKIFRVDTILVCTEEAKEKIKDVPVWALK